MVVVAIIGVLAAVAVPTFMRNARKAKTTEAIVNIRKMFEGARAYYEQDMNSRGTIASIPKQFPDSGTGMFPINPAPALGTCCSHAGKKCAPTSSWWNGKGFQALMFSMDDPHYFSYGYLAGGTDLTAQFAVAAYGDLDCDTVYSTFEMVGSVQRDGTVTGQAGYYADKELE
jgi:type II secretory pathway pseudopilin PulG